MKWYLKALREGLNFSGRACRMEFWTFGLVQTLIMLAGAGASVLLSSAGMETLASVIIVIFSLYSLGTLPPTISVQVRRLHDAGYNGWWFFISFIPYVGPFISLILMLLDGTNGQNKYGPDPKSENLESVVVTV